MQVAELMTKFPHVVQADQSIRHAAEAMANHDIGAVLVYEQARLVGIVTDRDIVVRGVAQGMPDSEPIRNVMTRDPITIAPTDSADEALRIMVERSVGRLCVVDSGEVRGIITFGDLSVLTRLVADGLARAQPVSA